MTKRADGTHVGMLVDFFEQVNRRLNTRIRLHIEDSWAGVQKKTQNREIDGLAFGGRDPRRASLYNATDILVSTPFFPNLPVPCLTLILSAETVKGHLQNIYQKIEVNNCREAVEKAKKIGIL